MDTESSWRPRTENEARDILDSQYGSGQFNRSVQAGPIYCSTCATGAWYANLGEEYGAYRAAYVVAQSALGTHKKPASGLNETGFEGST